VTQQQLEKAIEKVVESRLPMMVEQTIVQQYSYSGPLPPSEETERYEKVHPGFTDRWIKMSEKEQEERFKVIKRRDYLEIIYRTLVLAVSSFIMLGLVGGGIFLLYQNKTMEGFASIGVAVAAVIGALIYKGSKTK
jgi:uncharacterized membrane protein